MDGHKALAIGRHANICHRRSAAWLQSPSGVQIADLSPLGRSGDDGEVVLIELGGAPVIRVHKARKRRRNVCNWHLADIGTLLIHVRFRE
jgi:hypothetical protein